ncbi:MAG: hypothetical protein ACP5MZ_02350 [Candidatus Micrarchaeia archaeon]
MGNDKGTVKRIAEERIGILLDIAESFYKGQAPKGVDEALVKKYISLAMQIRRHYKIRGKDKRFGTICKGCHTMLIPGITCTVRVLGKERAAVYKCNRCGTEKRTAFHKMQATT